MASRLNPTWTAFLLMCFAVVGLTGLFGTFVAGVPLLRALERHATLDEVLAAAREPDAAARLERLRRPLAESAGPVLSGEGTLEERVARERTAMRERQEREARGVTGRIRTLIVLVTVMAAAFGVFIMGLSRR